MFGDINLSEAPIRGNHNPGAGGWPTIKYFNKESPDGVAYEKKTDMSMCDELGPSHSYMEDYIEEAGKTSLCAVDGKNCDEKSLKYLEKQKGSDMSSWKAQIARLSSLEAGDMKEELKLWIKKRKKILSSLVAHHEVKEEL